MSTGFEIKLQWPHIHDITDQVVYHEADLPAGIPETHNVRGQAWIVNEDWGLTLVVTVQLWLQDPMGQIRGYREQTFTLAPNKMELMRAEPVVLDLPGRWRLQGRYQYDMWDWNRTWDAIDCLSTSHNLTLASQNGGSIYAYADGREITVGPGQSRTIEVSRGSTVSLQALAGSGYKFRRWTGQPIDGNTSTMVQFQMMGNYSITASWEEVVVEPGILQGYVMEYGTGTPIQGATVKSGIYSATTNSAGYYKITGIPAGSYTFEYSALGYWAEQRGVLIQSGRTTTLDVALKEVGNGNGNGNGNGEENGEILKYVLIAGGVVLGAVLIRQIAGRR